ncbi:MAG: HEAT repeat domain-containing protein [Proteobacteria bacterium]|nr:HEAT repeat domain-containing protein [Pseudomonadota bacterium]
MKTLAKVLLISTALLLSANSAAQSDIDDVAAVSDVAEVLKIAAIEALMFAPEDRALPIIKKVLAGNHSDEVKESALFILSQLDAPEAQEVLIGVAQDGSGEIQLEAIRMIGIGGGGDALAGLAPLYESGDSDVREAVLEALMIAGDSKAVYDIALHAEGDDFQVAVDVLAVMGAHAELHELRLHTGPSEALIEAYAVSGDFEALRDLALDSSDLELQTHAIEAMGIVGGDQVQATLVEIYRGSSSEDIREAALDGMLISDSDEAVLELYRSSSDPAEKKELLEYLVIMGSDDVWNIIDATLEGNR